MARVTVEDCVQQVPNRFELVMIAAQRARDITAGAALSLERDNDKNPVVALREIAEVKVPLDALREQLVKGHQKVQEPDEPEEEIVELMAGEEEWLARGVSTERAIAAGDAEEAEEVVDEEEEAAPEEPDAAEVADEAER